jgi:8-oxo-dGTP diphosphatase
MSPAGSPGRKLTRVAVGVLVRGDGCVLLADRPAGKPYAGYWEFPGGKIEPGEDVAAALARELHEELGIDIGPSAPWVTFEFDYPHAYVELQFRRVYRWRGEPHAREGQRLDFFDPAGKLPHPLLPAAVPVLRWLLLPPTVLVTGPDGPPALAAAGALSGQTEAADAPPIIVVDADWRGADSQAVFDRLRGERAEGRPLLLASGPGAQRIAHADGVVLEPAAMSKAGPRADGMCGAWVDSAEGLRLASEVGGDFVLVRSARLAASLRISPSSLPAYLPADKTSARVVPSLQSPAQGYWIDLRSPPEAGR